MLAASNDVGCRVAEAGAASAFDTVSGPLGYRVPRRFNAYGGSVIYFRIN